MAHSADIIVLSYSSKSKSKIYSIAF